MNEYQIFELYMALKAHFTSKSYNIIKYCGRIPSANPFIYSKRKDKGFFKAVSKYTDPKGYMIANIIRKPDLWIGDLVNSEEADETYNKWSKIKQSLTYTFQQELHNLNEDFNSNFIVPEGEHPHILKLYIRGKISLDTLTILCQMTNCIPNWDKKLQDDMLWKKYHLLISKYSSFLNYDEEKMKKLVLDKFDKKGNS